MRPLRCSDRGLRRTPKGGSGSPTDRYRIPTPPTQKTALRQQYQRREKFLLLIGTLVKQVVRRFAEGADPSRTGRQVVCAGGRPWRHFPAWRSRRPETLRSEGDEPCTHLVLRRAMGCRRETVAECGLGMSEGSGLRKVRTPVHLADQPVGKGLHRGETGRPAAWQGSGPWGNRSSSSLRRVRTLLTITTLPNWSECNGNTKTDRSAEKRAVGNGRQRRTVAVQNPTEIYSHCSRLG